MAQSYDGVPHGRHDYVEDRFLLTGEMPRSLSLKWEG